MRRDIPYSMAIKAYVDTILRTYLLQISKNLISMIYAYNIFIHTPLINNPRFEF